MGSKVIGFRVPVDLAEELERVSSERGQTTAEFLRGLVDDALYPPKDAAGPVPATRANFSRLRERLSKAKGEAVPATLEDIMGGEGKKVTLGEELKGEVDRVSKEVTKLKEELAGSIKRIDASVVGLVERQSDYARLAGEIIGRREEELASKLSKLHVCPDCGNSLHMHLVGEKTGTGNWHLECPLCGYCSEDYGAPKWKEPRRHLFATKLPDSIPKPPENIADKKPTKIIFVARGAKAS